MKLQPRFRYWLWICSWALGPAVFVLSGAQAVPRKVSEREAYEISKRLKPIPDVEWSRIAGPRVSERYEVIAGDTLYDISRHLFGDSGYWPKIWALNNDGITNPHFILPKNSIAFMPGSGSSLPSISLTVSDQGQPNMVSDASSALASNLGRRSRSEDWKSFPKQPWEQYQAFLPPEVDPLGFDKNSKIVFSQPKGFELPAIATSSRLAPLGRIDHASSEGSYISLEQNVYIRAFENLNVGQVYAITRDPYPLKSAATQRDGYSYMVLGKVRITGVEDQQFIGTIISVHEEIKRGDFLMALPSRVKEMDPVPGPSPITGSLLVDRNFSTFSTAQHKLVFVDRGTEDGVQPGMIFRVYEHEDPATNARIFNSDIIVNGDVMVVQVSERFSIGIVIRSDIVLREEMRMTLLTDVLQLKGKVRRGLKGLGIKTPEDPLEKLDEYGNDQPTEKEKKELDQLNQHQEESEVQSEPAESTEEVAPLPPPAEIQDMGNLPPPETAPVENTPSESPPVENTTSESTSTPESAPSETASPESDPDEPPPTTVVPPSIIEDEPVSEPVAKPAPKKSTSPSKGSSRSSKSSSKQPQGDELDALPPPPPPSELMKP